MSYVFISNTKFLVLISTILILFLTVPPTFSEKFNPTKAREYHEIAIQRADDGNYKTALAYFRASVRLDNSSALYWNDLGVTEMRMGFLQKAKRRFYKSLEINPLFDVAQDNLNDLSEAMTADDFKRGTKLSYLQHHKINEIIELSTEDFASLTFFNNNNSLILKPFIIRNASSKFGWLTHKIDLDFLLRHYKNERIDFYPHNMLDEKVHPFYSSLEDAIRQLIGHPEDVYETVDASEMGTYLQWNVIDDQVWKTLLDRARIKLPWGHIFTDHWWSNTCLKNIKNMEYEVENFTSTFNFNTHWKMLLIGEEGAGMFNHKDFLRTSSWQIQLQGRKKWHICSSLDDKKMYHAGEVDTFKPDYKYFPKFRNVKTCTQFILYPGDLVFYPKDYWHQTLNLDTPTMAMSATIITSDCHVQVKQELQQECAGGNKVFVADEIFCGQLEKCYKIWENTFDPEIIQSKKIKNEIIGNEL